MATSDQSSEKPKSMEVKERKKRIKTLAMSLDSTHNPSIERAIRVAYETVRAPRVSRRLSMLSMLLDNLSDKQISSLKDIIERQKIEIKALKEKKLECNELVESIKDGRKGKNALISQMVQGAKFAKLLGVSRQTINTQRNQGKLIAVGDKNGNYYPTWQVGKDHKVYDVIPAVIQEIGYDDDWSHVLFFLNANEFLNGKTPRSLLGTKDNEELILNAAKVYNQHIAL